MGGWDLHMHTTFCDGQNTPEEMVQAAIKLGLEGIGFSGHAYMPFHEQGVMSREGTEQYRAEIARLKEKYRGRLKILCGIEQDFWCGRPPEGCFDYVIGSVHFVKKDGQYLGVDHSPQMFEANVNEYYGGDFYAFAEDYFALEAQVVEQTGADIIGHFDLVTKFNELGGYLDLSDPRYVRAWKAAVDALLAYDRPFEINTGAISRGYRTTPYPGAAVVNYIRSRGGRLILNSDSHSDKTLCFQFDRWKHLTQ